ncbi:insulinase family protein [Haemophilus paraphrohaemolyticus]|uniref:Insulinase family protein n=1 Tax=Haemophilus paraphrohaemolyticus TaxID=736 RepID=A0A369ZUQ6_9PAST|nr:insulinase family protein [Haemophilus paraphrohaemolyticus]RDF10155.1 insulinase family protein [Haemophilus paraphrohaemolyticus]
MRFALTTLALLIASNFAVAEKSAPVQGQLDNGLKYTILPLHDEKGHIEIRMRVNAGSVDENNDQAGVAHMVERLVFRGTNAHPNGLIPYLHEQKWVRGKNYNAITTSDSTTYMMTPPNTAGLSKSFDALSQMLFGAKLTQTDLDDERKIILEEWRQGLSVGATMNEQRTASVRANSRYARHRVIGTEQSINSMPATQLQQFYQTWYTPNNMNLLVVGDVDPSKAKEEIDLYFGKVEKKNTPVRDYLNPTLADRLQINKLQDPRSSVSQVAYILRFDDGASRAQTDDGRYQRLLDRLALASIVQRLRNQSEILPKGVSAVVPRKSDIGTQTTALGLFATVEPTGHPQGLKQIFEEIERLKRFPITEEELAKQKAPIQAQIENAKKHDGDREFSRWVQAMIDTTLLDKPFLTQPEIANLSEPILKKITAAEVNARIQQWLEAKDRIVQYQPPRDTKLEISETQVVQLQAEAQKAEISAPQQEKEIVPMSLEHVQAKGSITSVEKFDAQNVQQWTLSNGDKVVWLKSPLAKDKTYFQAQSSAGFKAKGLGEWQSQVALQLIAQNAPLDWEPEQLKHWKELNKVSISLKQTATKLIFDGSVENAKLADFLRLFYAYQAETKVKDGLDETKETLGKMIATQNGKNSENERLKAISILRYNQEKVDDILPNKDSLEQLTDKSLNEEWAKMLQAPTTYYFMNDMNEDEMKGLVTQFLSDFPRSKRFDSVQVLPTEGKAIASFAMNPEPKSDVKMWAFSSHQWQGKDAVLVSILRNIATNKLKMALRDKELGIYSLHFESSLNPETDRIESELSFVANPDNADKLIGQARAVFYALPEQITEEDVKIAKAQFVTAEKDHLQEPRTWLARLILSENHTGNPQYLTEMQSLADGITLDNVKAMAKEIYNTNNEKVFITTPKR